MNVSNYYLGCELILPKPWKTYFQPGSEEWNELDEEEKFMDLTYTQDNGLDILECIEDYMSEHDYVRERDVKEALCRHISAIRYGRRKKEDRLRTMNILEDNLNVEELTKLLRTELLIRFSYQTDSKGNLTFSQKYLNGTNATSCSICHPTGWHNVTKEWLETHNPWRKLAESYQGHDLYSTTREFACDADKRLLDLYNKKKKNENHKYHLEIPAEPWQGNPLTAQIVILSLNPGWQEECNKGVAETLPEQMREEVFKEKQRTLLFKAEGFFPFRKDVTDAISRVGENYWRGDEKKKGRLSVLKPEGMDEFEFYKKFAVVQYCAYTSKEYGGGFSKSEYLPTQLFTKELVRYLAYNRPEVKFVILRAVDKWKELLDPDVWLKMKQNTIVAKHPIQQRFNAGNLGEREFAELMDIIEKR